MPSVPERNPGNDLAQRAPAQVACCHSSPCRFALDHLGTDVGGAYRTPGPGRGSAGALYGVNTEAAINALNSVIRGWAAYYPQGLQGDLLRPGPPSVAAHLPVALRAHPNIPKRWVEDRYSGAFRHAGKGCWVFGDRDSGRYLAKFS